MQPRRTFGAGVWPLPPAPTPLHTTGLEQVPGLIGGRVGRDLAMSVPAVKQGVSLIGGTCGTFDLIVADSRNQPLPPPTFLKQPDVDEPATVTWTRIYTDLVLYPFAWLRVVERLADGFPLHGYVMPADRISILDGRVMFDGDPVPARDVIRFDSPIAPGVLYDGARIIRTAVLVERAVLRYADLDIPAGYLKQTSGPELLPDEIDELLAAWEQARQKRTTAYLSQGLDYANPAFDPARLQLVEARAANAVDVARLLNIPPAYLNAETGGSLTYATTESQARQLVNTTLLPYLKAVTGRLTMGDVTPRGQVIRPDMSVLMTADESTRAATAATWLGAGVLTVDEIRAREGMPPR